MLKDAYKTTVFRLAEWRNANRTGLCQGPVGPVMPQSVIDKPPSAELRHDQRDDESLPPYPLLDRILRALIEGEASVDDLAADGVDRALAARIEGLLYRAEYKRRQAPARREAGRSQLRSRPALSDHQHVQDWRVRVVSPYLPKLVLERRTTGGTPVVEGWCRTFERALSHTSALPPLHHRADARRSLSPNKLRGKCR